MRADLGAWAAAGGDPARAALYSEIGAVALFVDDDGGRCLASVHPARPTIGALADWVGGGAVRAEAEAWLAARGCTVARGPLELCRWFPYRATLGPFDDPPFVHEVTQRADRWAAAGYAPIAQYASVVADGGAQIRHAADRAASLSARGWSIATLPAGADGRVAVRAWDELGEEVHALLSAAWGAHDGWPAIPYGVLRGWYAQFLGELAPGLSYVARDPHGRLAGAVFAMRDRDAERGWFVIAGLAVHPGHQRSGIGSWLLGACHRAGKRAGCRAGVHALIEVPPSGREDGLFFAGRVIRRYALLERPLTPPGEAAP